MNPEDLSQAIQASQKDLATVEGIYKKNDIEGKIAQAQSKSEAPDFWSRKDSDKIMSELGDLTETKNSIESVTKRLADISELSQLFGQDEQQAQELIKDLGQVAKSISALKVKLILSGPYDSSNCFVSINPGAGGTESQDWADMLLRMYLRFCEQKKFQAKVIDLQPGGEAGIKGATIFVKGKNAYGLLKAETGVHRLVRISPFDSSKRRHTSFASMMATPEVPETQIDIKPDELKIDTFRAGGAGGQHVNTTDSAVRITHIPTGTITQCQNERSQAQNKQQAMKMLMSKLAELEEQKRRDKQNVAEKKKIEWGSQIRSYVLHPYQMVKDHRTGFESPRPEAILDGDIEDFINSYLQEFS